MRFILPIVTIASVMSMVACSGRDPVADEANNTAAAPAEVDVLPPDESVATPTDELENGDDEDVNVSDAAESPKAKAEALALLEAAGAPVANLQVFPDAGPTWHPGRSATLRLGPKVIVAAFGEIHPRLVRELDAPERAVAAEVYLDAIPQPRSGGHARPHFTPPALQPVTRDFAFIVPADLTADTLVRAIRGADKQAIIAARLFDRFEAPEGLSLAVEVTLQPGEKSFTEAELAEIGKRIVGAAEKLGARLRS